MPRVIPNWILDKQQQLKSYKHFGGKWQSILKFYDVCNILWNGSAIRMYSYREKEKIYGESQEF